MCIRQLTILGRDHGFAQTYQAASGVAADGKDYLAGGYPGTPTGGQIFAQDV